MGIFCNATNLIKGPYASADDLATIIEDKINSICTPGDATSWMDICRTARQPYTLWHVDYVEPRDSLILVNNFIRESEIILYGNKTSLLLKKGYSADLQQQAAFNTIRAHLRSEEGDFDIALTIFNELLNSFYDKLTTIRQSNLLMHGCLAFVCCGKFRDSYQCFQKHWVLLKSLSEDQRLSLGVWDNHLILHMIYWHIASHVEDFKDFYEIESDTDDIIAHKKIALLKCLSYDQTWVASFMGLPFHKHLHELYPTFPPWEKKTTTPENFLTIWEKNPGEELRKEKQGTPSIEKQYYERYNRQFTAHTRPNEDEVENCLYSYYSFQDSEAKEYALQDRLNIFINNHLQSNDYKTILSVGPGLIYPYQYHGRIITAVDISERICKRLKVLCESPQRSGVNIIHKCMSKFIRETEETFDLCIARDVLQNLSRSRLDMFLNYLPTKCKHLAALIDLNTDIRTDIISGSSLDQNACLHKSVLTEEEWINLLRRYFDILHETDGHHLYIYGKSKI